jgi:hypothetical protein
MRVYVAGPYTSCPQGNTHLAMIAGNELLEKGHIPFIPHLSHYWDEIFPHHYEVWMKIDFAFVEVCEAMLRLPGQSSGADREVALAEKLGIPVYYSIEEVPNGIQTSER